jgi:cell division protein FtsB
LLKLITAKKLEPKLYNSTKEILKMQFESCQERKKSIAPVLKLVKVHNRQKKQSKTKICSKEIWKVEIQSVEERNISTTPVLKKNSTPLRPSRTPVVINIIKKQHQSPPNMLQNSVLNYNSQILQIKKLEHENATLRQENENLQNQLKNCLNVDEAKVVVEFIDSYIKMENHQEAQPLEL